MRKLFAMIVVCAAVLVGCKKDEESENPCEGITCQNGGTCNDGSCNCPAGYSGEFCQIAPNPCADITCQNGGTCVNGECQCPSGFSGNNCQNQLPSQTMTVTKVVVYSFPYANSSGENFDFADAPDIYVVGAVGQSISNPTFQTGYESNADPDGIYTFSGLNWTFQSNTNVSIGLYDFDTFDANDVMGGLYFLPQNEDAGWPQYIDLIGGDYHLRVFVSWTW